MLGKDIKKSLELIIRKRGMKIALDISISFFQTERRVQIIRLVQLIQKIMEEAKQSDMCQKRN